MYVCICRQITDNQIRDLCRDGVSTMTDLRAKLGVASECGKCGKLAQTIVKEFTRSTPFVNAAG
jgi:bacterioferritin-associated ferredoxin